MAPLTLTSSIAFFQPRHNKYTLLLLASKRNLPAGLVCVKKCTHFGTHTSTERKPLTPARYATKINKNQNGQVSEKGWSDPEDEALFRSPTAKADHTLKVFASGFPVLRKKGGSDKPTPRKRLPRQILGQLCISQFYTHVRGNRLWWVPARRIENSLCKFDREVLRPDAGGD